MLIEVKVHLSPQDRARVESVFGDLVERTENIEGALPNVGEALLITTDERFDTETDPQGKAWAPLALTTIMLRGGSGHILSVSGRLRRSVSYNVSGNVLRLGPNAPPYDAAQQFGSTHEIRARNANALRVPFVGAGGFGFTFLKAVIVSIPARPYIGFGRRDEEAARDAIEDWLAVDGSSPEGD
ncbi:phage gpG-like protein [Ancylobacter sp. 3268]|uniref:phage virion morphogenesis protein n=1 Tax=Ancylobacter sp. 3268 TaxID=2817752 RepID=UPI0028587FA6|nr:phage virion morphogenesis protein [Ancylobacter sp. 3268]MDR6952669.1 phage gpG-like protein [Ancylobacter sp. 3268]